jgi:hypothetical protein
MALETKKDQLTLGELIDKFERISKRQKVRLDDGRTEAYVQFDFEYFFPNSIDSWRGSYNELALGFIHADCGKDFITVRNFLRLLKETVGKTFEGWKGGQYKMERNTPVWVANPGNSGNTAVIDVLDDDYVVYIITGLREF